MNISQAVAFFGNQSKVAEAIGLKRPIISIYKKKGGIPYSHQCELEKASKGKLKACREDDPDNVFYKPKAA